MKYLLDTNACIDYLRHGSRSYLVSRMKTEAVGNLAMCSVVRSELMYGAHRGNKTSADLVAVTEFCQGFNSFPFDDRAADIAGELRSYLAKLGTPIGPNDLLIAAIALANQLTVVTTNTGEFSRVPNLLVEDWSQP